jgi:hypothetical protein
MQTGREPEARNPQLYRELIEFISLDVQSERHLVNRRMFGVFVWCFLLPAIVSAMALLLIKFKVLPLRTRAVLDWIVLVFPVAYSLYILGSEVLAPIPARFRRGSAANVLGQSTKDIEWRTRVCAGMQKAVNATPAEWRWMVESLRIDLDAIQYRTRYLTGLAGAVFFLLMQGIDSLGGETVIENPATWQKNTLMAWIESSSNDLSQFVGLSLFLLLLYLSGSQTYYSLRRYLGCAELNLVALESSKSGSR